MENSVTTTEVYHYRDADKSAAVFSFDTSTFGGKHKPATAKRIAAAKKALREATSLYHAAIAAIEGKPAPSAKTGVLVVCSQRVKFLRTEKQEVTQTLRALSTTQSETLTETVDAVVEVFELAPGVPTLVPAWAAKLPHFLSLQKDGALSAL